ncbi:MAG TPA: molybdopterin-dependent oxidoreductase [Solirubrobacteraceae bacterium]|nr:molybdopterin-dependent oxidoreductase [Solirubrobacteraceae bacterium]
MTPRVTDWGLAALVAALIVTGALTLFAGSPGDAWVYDVHDALGAAIAVLLAFKVRRVWPRVKNGPAVISLVALGVVALTLASGFLWSDGATPAPAGYSLLSWHDALGAVLVVAVAGHMVLRARRVRARDLASRRQFLVASGIAAASFVAWRVQRPVESLLGLGGATRRFTGSYEAGSFAGNDFPTTSWVADSPRAIDPADYRLAVAGLVSTPLMLRLSELLPDDELVATLDCTGGFYSTQRWRGVSLARVLELAGASPQARHVSVASVTGYRWSFGIDYARELLLATQVGDEPLSHPHGAPVRLVVPGARGFQWVKWVDRVVVNRDVDLGATASTVWSSFTAAGQGS